MPRLLLLALSIAAVTPAATPDAGTRAGSGTKRHRFSHGISPLGTRCERSSKQRRVRKTDGHGTSVEMTA